MRIGILGCCGKVGKYLVKEIYYKNPALLSGGLDSPSSPLINKDLGNVIGVGDIGLKVSSNIKEVFSNSSVLLDFTNNNASIDYIRAAVKYKKPIVVGTTGFTDKQESEIKNLAKDTVIVKCTNMSLGMNVLFKLVEYASQILRTDYYDIEIIEKHHKDKKDAPSGTALSLGNIIAKGNNIDLKDIYHGPRKGITAGREHNKIAFHSVRGGDLAGEHTVMFLGEGEVIELKHTSYSRVVYAVGALKAAEWALKQPNGLYSFEDVVSKSQ